MSKVTTAIEAVPGSLQTGASVTSLGAAFSAFVGVIQGPLAVVASCFSIIWLGLQIYTWVERRLKPPGRQRKGDR